MSNEQPRKYERIAIELPCRLYVEDKNGDLRFEAYSTTGNLCLGGVFVVSDFLLKEGVEITTELALPSGPLSIHGTITHAVDKSDEVHEGGMGIAFENVDEEARETLLRYFTPVRYDEFYATVLNEFPHIESELEVSQISLVLNLWEEWKVTLGGGPKGTASGAPEAIRKRKR